MKNVLLLLCCLFSAAVFAQSKTQVVTNVETDDSFSFRVKFDKSKNDDLVDAYLKVINFDAKKPVSMTRFEGKSETTTARGTTVELNTHKSLLLIRSSKGNEESRAEAECYANIVRAELGLEVPETPTPPTPPSGH